MCFMHVFHNFPKNSAADMGHPLLHCRATFTLKSLEVRVVALQGKNYVYAVKSLFMPINVDGCHVAASKTKKNVLITLQVHVTCVIEL